jgi:hypothetical protein
MFDTEQPDGAVMQHHGVSSPQVDGRVYRFVPVGARGLPVVVIDVPGGAEWDSDGNLTNGLRRGELRALADELSGLGYAHHDTWNGDRCMTGSVGLRRPAHPSLVAAVARYHAGCPDHGNVFCSCPEPACLWYASGYGRVVQPTWAAAGLTEPEQAVPTWTT